MKEWIHFDKKKWPPGPWKKEPDLAVWVYKNYHCRIERGEYGAFCGYVSVPPGHPLFELNNNDIKKRYPELRCHGGITHTESELVSNEKIGWWIGFDCNHATDIAPLKEPFYSGQVYRNFQYVKNETESLAQFLEMVEKKEIT